MIKLEYDIVGERTLLLYEQMEGVQKKRPDEVVAEFYQVVNGRPLSDEQSKLVEEMMEEVWEEER